jgi:hypothetical protein
MTKKDTMELRRRFTKDGCTFTRMSCCYVNHKKEKVVTDTQSFLNLEDEEFYKYLDIAKKTTSGKIGNNLLELEFPLKEEQGGGKQAFLMGLKQSKLQNEDLLDRLYDLIIENYYYVGNYLILAFHDVYDVMVKTSDNRALDESEEVYEYLIVSICPVTLSKPGLGYLEEENRIGPRIRDWIVSPPENGFLFPAFTDRSSDIHSLMYYTKSAKDPKPEFMEEGLGCKKKRTILEQKNEFKEILESSLGEEHEEVIKQIHQTLNERVVIEEEKEQPAPLVLDKEVLKEVLEESGVPKEVAPKIEESYESCFKDEAPVMESVLDKKTIKKIEEMETKKHMDEVRNFDVVLQTNPEKADSVQARMIDGKRCIVIPLEENEYATVNGRQLEE